MSRPLTDEEMRKFKERQRAAAERTAKLLGISVEELEARENAARAKIEAEGDEWEKELDRKNKAKAGITE